MAIAVTTEWFYDRYNRAFQTLGDIGRISGGVVSIDTHSSTTGKGLVTEYGHLRDTVALMLNNMASDWNAAKVCVSNLTHFDTYISHLINNESTNHMEYGCDALWHSGDADDRDLIVSGIEPLGYPGFGNYISSEHIADLTVLCDKLTAISDALARYSSIVEEVTSAEGFSGMTFNAIKSYMARVHVPVARSLRSVCVTFISTVRTYQETYNITMGDDTFLYDKGHLNIFRQRLADSFRSLREKIGDFNNYVYMKNAAHEGLCLEDIKHYTIDNVESRIHAQLAEVDSIIDIIEENEAAGQRDVTELQGYINLLDEVAAEIGMGSGYRMISPTRRFSSISSLNRIRERGFDIYEFYFGLLTDGSGLQRTRAEEFLRADIRANLIESFRNRDVSHFHYNEYRGYDEDVLLSKIEGLDLSDKNFVRRWGELYHSMTADGYTDLRAIRYSEIAALFNREGILAYSGGQGDLDKIITTGIQRYVVDYAGYIADHDAYGYNQVDRWGANGDFDCSSLVIAAYEKAFIDLRFAMNQTRPEDDEWSYWHIGSYKLSTKPLDDYGFTIFTPNVDIKVTELVPGDIFAIDNDHANHVEVFAGRFERDGKVEYLNVSAHSSERIGGYDQYGNGRADYSGDQLHQWGPEGIRTHGLGTPWSTYIYETTLVGEEGGSYNSNGDDVWGHDRIGEIRYENIGPRPEWKHSDDHITGCLKWPQHYEFFDENGNELPEQREYIMEETPWSRIMRLENMEYWKTDH